MFIQHNKIENNICRFVIDKFDELKNKNIVSNITNDDVRIFGFEKVLGKGLANFFFNLDKKSSIKFFKKEPLFQTIMVNKTFKPENGFGLGSGAGWHRDSYLKKQMKTIFYLTKVNNDNGPFTFLEPKNKIFSRSYPFGRRYGEDINKYLNFCGHKKIITSNEPGYGFSIISNFIHRGMPVKNGVRYALTVYSSIYNDNEIYENLKSKFINLYEKKGF